jgi:hypothetical protein
MPHAVQLELRARTWAASGTVPDASRLEGVDEYHIGLVCRTAPIVRHM